jgi:hypothetical protein
MRGWDDQADGIGNMRISLVFSIFSSLSVFNSLVPATLFSLCVSHFHFPTSRCGALQIWGWLMAAACCRRYSRHVLVAILMRQYGKMLWTL